MGDVRIKSVTKQGMKYALLAEPILESMSVGSGIVVWKGSSFCLKVRLG